MFRVGSMVNKMSQLSWKYKDIRWEEYECRGNVVEIMSIIARKPYIWLSVFDKVSAVTVWLGSIWFKLELEVEGV